MVNDTMSISNEKLPSVTTILQATQSEEKRKKLEEWEREWAHSMQTG